VIVDFVLNGKRLRIDCDPGRRVVDYLREEAGLTGVKEGCGTGECGACTVLVDGVAKLSCLMLMAQLAGRELLTVEGLGSVESPHPIQAAFAGHGAVQCGFCTPGMVMAAAELLAADPDPSRETVRRAISGNLCRCTGYVKIVDAITAAAHGLNEARKDKD
jgi:carbon-monoxide dehydrogenase small subunit